MSRVFLLGLIAPGDYKTRRHQNERIEEWLTRGAHP